MTGKIEELVRVARDAKASDIHLVVGYAPKFRVNGALRELNAEPLTADDCIDYAEQIVGVRVCERVQECGEADTARTIAGVRCRVNVFRQQGVLSIALRLLSDEIPPMDVLGLPKVLGRFIDMHSGLILVTGETGSGKSTTLASVIDRICKTRPVHVVTLEDPIEYIYTSVDRALVNQREIGIDTESFSDGIRAVLREDPDVILIGEMRDTDTISNAIRAAETGHLVFATLHTRSAADTVNRIIDVFPEKQQAQIRLELAGSLNAVVTQQLLPCLQGGRVLAAEVMMMNAGIRTLIRDNKTHQIDNAISTGSQDGSIAMDSSLILLYRQGKISRFSCITAARDPEYVKKAILSSDTGRRR